MTSSDASHGYSLQEMALSEARALPLCGASKKRPHKPIAVLVTIRCPRGRLCASKDSSSAFQPGQSSVGSLGPQAIVEADGAVTLVGVESFGTK